MRLRGIALFCLAAAVMLGIIGVVNHFGPVSELNKCVENNMEEYQQRVIDCLNKDKLTVNQCKNNAKYLICLDQL